MYHLFIKANPRRFILLERSPMQFVKTLRCGSITLTPQNGVFHFVSLKIVKHLRVFLPRVFFMLPCSIFRTVLGLLNLCYPYGLVPEKFDFPIQNAYWFHPKILFMLHLDHIPINYVVRLRHIFI
jgi:hypothetical protein